MDDGGLQRQSNRALLGAVSARLVGVALFEAGSLLRELSKAAWMVESHFGRRYESITGVDLAESVDEPGYLYRGWSDGEEELVEVDEDEEDE